MSVVKDVDLETMPSSFCQWWWWWCLVDVR